MTDPSLSPHELVALAGRLAVEGGRPGRPRTAELRRAVSTAYYGLFPGWTWVAAADLIGGDPDDPRVSAATRWITHTDVLELAKSVLLASGGMARNQVNAAKYLEPILSKPVDENLVRVCRNFVKLQELRHSADYDRDFTVDQEIALGAVAKAREALDGLWRLYADGDPNTVLLLRLTLGGTRIARSRA